jgi:phage-related protein
VEELLREIARDFGFEIDTLEVAVDHVHTLDALTIAAEGRKADIAKPMIGLGSGIFEVALAWRGDAYRTVYAVQIGRDIWVVHAFQKKSKTGSKTPKQEIDLIKKRLKQLRKMLT